MKPLASLFCTFALAASAFAAENDSLITFSTKGPDAYADGTVVLDGESYALVWTKTGVSFAGFLADGTVADAENSACLVTVPYAKDGHCPTICFQLSAALAETYADGTFSIYLLDTRIADGNGGYKVGGIQKSVNGFGAVTDGVAATAGISGGADAAGVSVTTVSDLPADMPKPVIKGIQLVDGYVHITVERTVPYLKYNLTAGDTPAELGETADAPKSGDATENLIFIAPADGDSGFFSVKGKGQLD